MTSAMMRALKSTRTVSAMPPSFFLVPVCTLIGLLSCGSRAPPRDLVTPQYHRRNCARGFAARSRNAVLSNDYMSLRPSRRNMTKFSSQLIASSYSVIFRNRLESKGKCSGSSTRRNGDRRNDDESVGHRSLVGDGEVDARLVAFGRDGVEAPLGAAGQLHGRPPRRQVDDAHVAPPHAGTDAGAERLGAGLLGGEALGVGLDPVAPPLGAGALVRREDAIDEAIAMALDDLGDAAHVGNVGADAEDHPAAPPSRRP